MILPIRSRAFLVDAAQKLRAKAIVPPIPASAATGASEGATLATPVVTTSAPNTAIAESTPVRTNVPRRSMTTDTDVPSASGRATMLSTLPSPDAFHIMPSAPECPGFALWK